MPRAVEGGEPDQWLALHVARETLRDAGYADGGPTRHRAALILGKGTYPNRGTISVVHHALVIDYTLRLLKAIHPELTEEDLLLVRNDLKQQLPRFDAETAPALIPNVTVGRIANRLDLMGPSYTVDAACASSLVAIDIAVKGLRERDYDLALVGGMQVATPAPVLSLFCRLNALSATQSIRPFDKDADGTLLSEGIGMAVLKRRADAELDGDRVYAVIKGTGIASDGRAVTVLAPRVEGEELALRRAYDAAGVPPQTVGLVEAHGTATLVGDAVEVEALTRVFGARNGLPRCALGSVKSMIGHTMPAAGMAGFIKATLALYHKLLPPTLNVTEPSPRLQLERTPFYINAEPRPWIHGGATSPRRAAVNAFGFGGINGHVILEEGSDEAHAARCEPAWDTDVCLFPGRTRDEVISLGQQVVALLARNPTVRLADLAFTLSQRARTDNGTATLCLGIVAESSADLARKLERAVGRLTDPSCHKVKDVSGVYFFAEPLAPRGKLAFLFPGEGAQYVNMLADLCGHFPAVRVCFDEMDRAFADHPRGYVLSDLVFPRPAFSDAERSTERLLWQMDVAVEAVHTANRAMHVLLSDLGLHPDALLGHSTGEYSALRAAGALDEREYDARVSELNRLYVDATAVGRVPPSARLLAIAASRDRVERLCARHGDAVSVAMDNCRHQVVVVARADVSDSVEELLRADGLLYERLAFDRPYHTPAFREFTDALPRFLHDLIVRPPAVPVYSATSVDLFPSDLARVRSLAYEHWIQPVEFSRTIQKMYADGVRIFVEVGPRGNLTAFVEDILAGQEFAAIPANVSRRSGITQLNHLLAQLAAQGAAFTTAPLYRRRSLQAIDLTASSHAGPSTRRLGPVKIPTGAPEMRISPDVAARVRARCGSSAVPEIGAADAAPAARSESAQPAPATTQPTPASAGDVMAAFMRTMDRFLMTQQSLIGLTHRGGERLPFIETVLREAAGESLVARCTIDLEKCPLLRDHTLGRHVSADDPDLPAFPIVPFTMLMETMAEAAVTLAPELRLTGMRDVRVHRWLAVDRGPITLEIHASRMQSGYVAVRVFDADASLETPVCEGGIVLDAAYPPAPLADEVELIDAQPYKWPADRLYDEAMFRGVASVDAVGEAGAHGTLVSAGSGRSGAADAHGFVTDVVLLDQPGQLVGFWASQLLDRGFVALPSRMKSLQLFGPTPPAGRALRCNARIARIGDQQLRSTLEIVEPDGRVWARLEGWEDRRFDLAPDAFRLLLRPREVMLSQPWNLPLDALVLERAVTRRIGLDLFAPGWLSAHGGLWARVLASIVLGRQERVRWHALKLPERRRIEWLLGRIAAKDAVREYVRQRSALTLHPADIELVPDQLGRPVVRGAWADRGGPVPLISISHADGVAVAIAADADRAGGIGIDLERVGRINRRIEQLAFTADEQALLDSVAAPQRDAWALRLWCAKEAAAKTTGEGFAAGVGAFAVEEMDTRSGGVKIRFSGRDRERQRATVSTAQEGEWIVAACAAAIREGVAT